MEAKYKPEVLGDPLATTSIQRCIDVICVWMRLVWEWGKLFPIVAQTEGTICARYQRKTKHASRKTDGLQFVCSIEKTHYVIQ